MRSRLLHRAERIGRPSNLSALVLAGLMALLSLGTVLRVYAMPVEARTTETWYSYRSALGFDFTAQVKPDRFYSQERLLPEELTRIKLPVEPVQYRRVIISRFAEEVEIKLPYQFMGDRDASLRGSLSLDGRLVVPGVWERPYPIMNPLPLAAQGRELSGVVSFKVPVGELLRDLEHSRSQMNLALEPLELVIRPTLTVDVDGLREPVSVQNDSEFRVVMRTATTEIDDVREKAMERAFTATQISPVMVPFLFRDVTVATLRSISITILVLAFATMLALFWLRHRRRSTADALTRLLGPHLIRADSFELPGDVAVAVVGSGRELLQLQQQTERPVIQAGDAYYLLDGTTCYQYTAERGAGLPSGPALGPGSGAAARPGSFSLENLRIIRAGQFTLDPWMTEVMVHREEDLHQLQASTGKTIIQTDIGRHLIEGSVCFTYRHSFELPPLVEETGRPQR